MFAVLKNIVGENTRKEMVIEVIVTLFMLVQDQYYILLNGPK